MATTCDSQNTRADRTVLLPFCGSDIRYSVEEIRFNLLAIAQRPLPILDARLRELNSIQSILQSYLNDRIPDWNALSELVPAMDSKVDASLVEKTVKRGDMQEVLSLKKALDRDITIVKMRIIDEEEKISEYTVRPTKKFLTSGNCHKTKK